MNKAQAHIKEKQLHLLLLIILSYPIFFLKLGSFHMRWWDESMFAVNAYEMIHNGKFFSFYFDGIPDLWNSKPPLSVWIQLIFIKLIGYNELACRLPSALAAAVTVLVLFDFLYSKFNVIWAWCAALILLTTYGFIDFHTARTAESDALLTLFLLLTNISFINFFLTNKKKYVLLFFLFITLAFATKIHAALLFAPAYLFALLMKQKTKQFVFNVQFVIGILVFLICSSALILLREHDSPGYVKQLFFEDAAMRMFSVLGNHQEAWDFYLNALFKSQFATWWIVFIAGALCCFWLKDKEAQMVLAHPILFVITHLTIISCSQTKLIWYDMPDFPLLSMVAGYALMGLISALQSNVSFLLNKKNSLILLLLFCYPYYIMFNKSQSNTIQPGEKILEAKERYIFKQINDEKNLNGLIVYHKAYKGSLLFYKYKLSERGQIIKLNNNGAFEPNEVVLVSDDSLLIDIKNKYLFEQLDKQEDACVLKIIKSL